MMNETGFERKRSLLHQDTVQAFPGHTEKNREHISCPGQDSVAYLPNSVAETRYGYLRS
jgi:hypothetical protein